MRTDIITIRDLGANDVLAEISPWAAQVRHGIYLKFENPRIYVLSSSVKFRDQNSNSTRAALYEDELLSPEAIKKICSDYIKGQSHWGLNLEYAADDHLMAVSLPGRDDTSNNIIMRVGVKDRIEVPGSIAAHIFADGINREHPENPRQIKLSTGEQILASNTAPACPDCLVNLNLKVEGLGENQKLIGSAFLEGGFIPLFEISLSVLKMEWDPVSQRALFSVQIVEAKSLLDKKHLDYEILPGIKMDTSTNLLRKQVASFLNDFENKVNHPIVTQLNKSSTQQAQNTARPITIDTLARFERTNTFSGLNFILAD